VIGTISGSITHRKFSAVRVVNKSEFAPQLSKPKNKCRVWLHFCVSAAAGYFKGQTLVKKIHISRRCCVVNLLHCSTTPNFQ
jgi:hypothetical protein